MHGNGLNRQPVPVDDLEAVGPDVLLAEMAGVLGVAGDDGGLVEVEAAVAVVEAEQGEHGEEVDIVAFLRVLPPRGVLASLRGDREGVPATGELLDLFLDRSVLGQTEGEGVVGPGAVDVEGDPGVREALDVVEPQGGGAVADAPGGVGSGGQVGFGEDRFGDAQQLALLLQRAEEFAQVVVSHGCSVEDEGKGWKGVGAHRCPRNAGQEAGRG